MKILVQQLIGELAITPEDGEKVFNHVNKAFDAKDVVQLDFTGVTTVVSAFLNQAIGQLFGRYDAETIRQKLDVVGLDQGDFAILALVLERAKEFYADPTIREFLERQGDDDNA